MNDQFLVAIIFNKDPQVKPMRYQYNIKNTDRYIDRFTRFAKSKGGKYINFYDKKSREYIGRQYVK